MKKVFFGFIALALILGFSQATETSANSEIITPLGFGHIHG